MHLHARLCHTQTNDFLLWTLFADTIMTVFADDSGVTRVTRPACLLIIQLRKNDSLFSPVMHVTESVATDTMQQGAHRRCPSGAGVSWSLWRDTMQQETPTARSQKMGAQLLRIYVIQVSVQFKSVKRCLPVTNKVEFNFFFFLSRVNENHLTRICS